MIHRCGDLHVDVWKGLTCLLLHVSGSAGNSPNLVENCRWDNECWLQEKITVNCCLTRASVFHYLVYFCWYRRGREKKTLNCWYNVIQNSGAGFKTTMNPSMAVSRRNEFHSLRCRDAVLAHICSNHPGKLGGFLFLFTNIIVLFPQFPKQLLNISMCSHLHFHSIADRPEAQLLQNTA